MPPPMPNTMSSMAMDYSNAGYMNINTGAAQNNYWGSSQHINDALSGESNSFLTIIKPKFKNPYQGMLLKNKLFLMCFFE